MTITAYASASYDTRSYQFDDAKLLPFQPENNVCPESREVSVPNLVICSIYDIAILQNSQINILTFLRYGSKGGEFCCVVT